MTGMDRRGNSGLLNNMEASHQENENNEGTACYAEIQTDRINVKQMEWLRDFLSHRMKLKKMK